VADGLGVAENQANYNALQMPEEAYMPEVNIRDALMNQKFIRLACKTATWWFRGD
jgi:hypothetical protein